MAAQLELTCASYGLEGFGLFLPQVETLDYLLSPLLGRPATDVAVHTYDALWIAARAHEHAGPGTDPARFWEELETQANRTYGMSGPTYLDMNGDRLFNAYRFYRVVQEGDSYKWSLVGLYRDAAFASEVVLFDE